MYFLDGLNPTVFGPSRLVLKATNYWGMIYLGSSSRNNTIIDLKEEGRLIEQDQSRLKEKSICHNWKRGNLIKSYYL